VRSDTAKGKIIDFKALAERGSGFSLICGATPWPFTPAIGAEGRPICSESWPGNATDVKAMLPVATRLRERFGLTRMCVVADRGMISAETMAELEALGLEYIPGARERSDGEVRAVVLADNRPMVPLVVPRARGAETDLAVREVVVGDRRPGGQPRRYVVCQTPDVWPRRSRPARP
jgi:hypothetical protein